MAKGAHKKKRVGKKARRLNREMAEQRAAVVNGLANELAKELERRFGKDGEA